MNKPEMHSRNANAYFKNYLRSVSSTIPIWDEQRIISAQPKQLENWSLQILDGKSVEDVLMVQEKPAKYTGGADG